MIIGAGHVALALSQMALPLEMRLVVVDDRSEFLTPERFPQAVQRIHVQYDRGTENLEPMPVNLTPSTNVVVATWGWEPALAQFLSHIQVGLYWLDLLQDEMARDTRNAAGTRDPCRKPGMGPRVSRLSLGAETPGEITLSILAEMLAVREKATALPMAAAHK